MAVQAIEALEPARVSGRRLLDLGYSHGWRSGRADSGVDTLPNTVTASISKPWSARHLISPQGHAHAFATTRRFFAQRLLWSIRILAESGGGEARE